MNRPLALTMVGLLAVSVLVPLSAVADQGLTVWVFAGPDTAGLGDDITVNVEAYMYDQPVDLDTLDVTAGLMSNVVNMTKTGTGKYHGTYKVDSNDAQYGFLTASAAGDLGAASASDTAFLFLGSGGGSGGWDMTVRLGDFGQMPVGIGPGTNVTVEARTYLDGVLADGGAVNATIVTAQYGGTGQDTQHVTMTKASDGVYRHTIQVPASLMATAPYSIDVQLGPGGDLASDSLSFTAQPFPVLAYLKNVAATSAEAQIIAGLDAPLTGANVSITGTVITTVPPYVQTLGPFTGSTDANGQALIHIHWTGTAPDTLETIVTSGGKTVGFPLVIGEGGSSWTPQEPVPFGCDATLQSDPTGIEPGTTAHLTFRVFEDDVPVASATVTVFSGDESSYGWSAVANKTTDAQGDFTVDFAVPPTWSFFEDSFALAVVCPAGEAGKTSEMIGSPGDMFSTGDVTVTAGATAAAGTDLPVTVQYTGSMPVAGAYGFAILVPGNDPTNFLGSLAGGAVGTNLTSSGGTTFTGTVHLPQNLPPGNYSLFVFLTNMGATDNRANEFQQGGFRAVTVSAYAGGNNNNNGGGNNQNGTGQNNTGETGSGGGFLPGFEAAFVAAAVAAVAVGLAGGRRARRT